MRFLFFIPCLFFMVVSATLLSSKREGMRMTGSFVLDMVVPVSLLLGVLFSMISRQVLF